MALVVGIAIVGMGLFFFSARARARAVKANADRAPVSATASTTTSTAEATPRAAPRANDGPRVQGGAKAKVSDLTAIGVDANGSRNAVNAALPRLDACFAASELEAPNHETATYDLDLAPTGVVTRAEPAAPGARAPRLDACVVSVLRGVRLPRSASGGRLKVTLAAPIRGG